MFSVESCGLPDGALLSRYCGSGNYTDCFRTVVPGSVSHEQFVAAFYTTAVFKLERWILSWAAAKPSTDEQALQLAAGTTDSFAAWLLEDRCQDQLLLTDFRGRTRSWLMVAPRENDRDEGTQLYFGSAVLPEDEAAKDEPSIAFGFRLLLGFHKLYSVVLLRAAKSRVLRI